MSPRDWDAASYVRVGAPVHAMGERLLERLELRGDETVVDAGCGSGEVTEKLLERLPEGRVIAVDGSESMVRQARERLPGENGQVLCRDLLELELAERADVVFSSATFHWIKDHERLFDRLHAALRPGGRLLAQCGGEGNIAQTAAALGVVAAREPFAAHLDGFWPWNFASPRVTAERLARAGFADVQVGLHEVPVTPEDPETYIATVIGGSHLDELPEALRDEFIGAVVAELPPDPTVVYVRLTMSARRPG